MRNKGFTLIELLATVVLLGLIFAITFPKILEVVERKNKQIDEATLKLIYNGVDKYMANDLETFPKQVGAAYCISLNDVDKANLIPVSIDDHLTEFVTVKIGKSSNKYEIAKVCNTCNSADCISYTNEKYNITDISVKQALDDLYTKLK